MNKKNKNTYNKFEVFYFMKISWLKSENDKNSFKFPENFGFDVYKLSNLDEVDSKIDELIKNNYNTIILSNEIAGFSQKINNEYIKNKNVEIIISK